MNEYELLGGLHNMHDETAYKKTVDKEIIPFSLAKQIRDF